MTLSVLTFAQDADEQQLKKLREGEDNLLRIVAGMQAETDAFRRDQLNDNLRNSLEETLELKGAISYPFDKFNAIASIGHAGDDLRVFTWELEDTSGINRYYGCVLSRAEDGNTQVFTLHDYSDSLPNAERKKLSAQTWYGAIYYDMRKVKYKKTTYFVLLGINRNALLTKKKIIEILTIDEDGIHFGLPVFDLPNSLNVHRKVYSYSTEADMSIVFEEDDLIVMDHLSPSQPNYEGKYQYYLPDLSFDALVLKKGRWNYKSDYDARLRKNLKDRYYNMELPKENKLY